MAKKKNNIPRDFEFPSVIFVTQEPGYTDSDQILLINDSLYGIEDGTKVARYELVGVYTQKVTEELV